MLTAMRRLNETSLQIVLVADAQGRLVGTLTDGDIRRGLLAGGTFDSPVDGFIQRKARTGSPGLSNAQALEVMRRLGIHALPLVEESGLLVGLITLDEAMGSGTETRTTPVVIMAGGRGARLRPLTDDEPKPLVRVNGEPLIDILIRRLSQQGFREIWLAVHYKAEAIRAHVGSGEQFDVNVRYLHETEPLGTAGALSLLPDGISEPILVMNADLMNAVDFAAMVSEHTRSGATGTVAVFEHMTEVPFGVMVTEGTRLLQMEEKPVRRDLVNAGVYVLDPAAVAHIPPGARMDMPAVLAAVLAAGDPVHVHPIDGYWIDIGTPAALARAQADHDIT